jgi:O-antigen/teichoic acid export membrane protein
VIDSVRRLGSRRRGSELSGLAEDSMYSLVWQGSTSVAYLVQIALITHALGLSEYGRLALAMSFVVLVGQLFDVRVGAAATMFGAKRIASADWPGVSAVFRFTYAIDAVTGIAGFAVLAAVAPLIGPYLVGGEGTKLILLYGLTLLASTVDETSITIVRLLDRFRLLAAYTTALEMLRVAAVALALLVDRSLTSVLVALVAYDVLCAVVNCSVGTFVFSRRARRSLWLAHAEPFDQKRAIVRTLFHTNVVSYARLAQVQLPTLLLGVLSTTTQVGLYKVGTAAGSIVARLADPAYTATLPRLSRLWAEGRQAEIRRLVLRAMPVAATFLGTALLLLILFRGPVLRVLGGSDQALAAGPVVILFAVAQTVNGIVFWNTGLLYAAGRSGAVSLIAFGGTLLQLGLVFPLVYEWGATGAAVALFGSLVSTNLVATALAIRSMRVAGASQSSEISADHRVSATLSEYEAST